MDIPLPLINSKMMLNSKGLQYLGIKIGKLYSDHGFPIDMALNRLPHTEDQKVAILDGVCKWLIEHKRLSGATDKAIDRQRKTNLKMLKDFIRTGETGIY